MTSVEFVRKICKERHIPIRKIESDLGYSNGYIGSLTKGTFPANRLMEIADYLNIPFDYLASGGESRPDFSERSAHLVMKRVQDPRLTDALEKYFELSEPQKQVVLDMINTLYEASCKKE